MLPLLHRVVTQGAAQFRAHAGEDTCCRCCRCCANAWRGCCRCCACACRGCCGDAGQSHKDACRLNKCFVVIVAQHTQPIAHMLIPANGAHTHPSRPQFKRAYKRNDKPVCSAAIKFIAHLANQQVRAAGRVCVSGCCCRRVRDLRLPPSLLHPSLLPPLPPRRRLSHNPVTNLLCVLLALTGGARAAAAGDPAAAAGEPQRRQRGGGGRLCERGAHWFMMHTMPNWILGLHWVMNAQLDALDRQRAMAVWVLVQQWAAACCVGGSCRLGCCIPWVNMKHCSRAHSSLARSSLHCRWARCSWTWPPRASLPSWTA